jgi:threonine dehydrogenase-like Zn-dependent dehydrogenase
LKAIATIPGLGRLSIIDQPEPTIKAPDEIIIIIKQVGICGIDREEARGGRAEAPDNQEYLVIGHEMLGQVIETGKNVTKVKPGDLAILTVRRGCGNCQLCLTNHPDLCQTGEYRERGIKGLDGYQIEFVIDQQKYIVLVPPQLGNVGLLTEPPSVAEIAIEEALKIQNVHIPDTLDRTTWWRGRRCLVAELGSIGLLAALALRLRGADVFGMDIVDQDTPRPQILLAIGGKYINGRNISADLFDSEIGPMEIIFESTGVAELEFNLLDALDSNGIYVLTGFPGGDRPLEIPGPQLIRQLVLGNLIMVGSVNASLNHFQTAVKDLMQAKNRWHGILEILITHRYTSTKFESAFLKHPANEIKTVIQWEGERK